MSSEYALWRKTFPKVETIRPQDAHQALEQHPDDVVLVDVRTAEEQAVSRLPGAVTAAEFEAHPERYTGKRLITYCTIGARSGTWAAKRRSDGFEVANLEGGLLGWAHAGYAFETPEGEPTHKAHTHSRPWALLPSGYEGVY